MSSKHQLSTERSTNPLATFKNEINDFFDRFSREVLPDTERSFMPKVEVKDNGSSYSLSAELPGMTEDDINVSLEDNTLIIEGEKKNESKREGKGFYRSEFSYGSFYRAIPLAKDVDADSVSASYKDGVLKIDLDKVPQAESKNKKIPINKAGATTGSATAKH